MLRFKNRLSGCVVCLFCCAALIFVGCRKLEGNVDAESLDLGTESEGDAASDRNGDLDSSEPENSDRDTVSIEIDSAWDSDTSFEPVDTETETRAVCIDYLSEPCCLQFEPLALCNLLDDCGEYIQYICCSGLSDTCEYWACARDACGDGMLNVEGEECDDGNTIPGDGCSGICKIEPYWICPIPGQPCFWNTACGNGIQEPGELCDDGNSVSGDGCAEDCSVVEPGFACLVPGDLCRRTESLFCGDGLVYRSEEQCDDGENDGGYDECFPGCVLGDRCGDGVVQLPFEACDDGADNGDYGKCNSGCSGWVRCGDGVRNSDYEDCDDGNAVDDDFCDNQCRCGRLP